MADADIAVVFGGRCRRKLVGVINNTRAGNDSKRQNVHTNPFLNWANVSVSSQSQHREQHVR